MNLLTSTDVWKRSRGRTRKVPQENLVLHEAELFRRLAALAWDERTIYPKSTYVADSPQGQCGVTNFGFGLWLARKRLVDPDCMFYEEGSIVTADGALVGDDHTWLRLTVDDAAMNPDLTMRLDCTADQFPGIIAPRVVVQYGDYFFPDPQTPSGNIVYVPDRVTRFSEYDTDRFGTRLDHFMRNVYARRPCHDT